MTQPLIDNDLAELTRHVAMAASAFIRGDIRTYLTYIKHADDYTLMSPAGGEPVRGFDDSAANIDAMERYFQAGEANLEIVQTYASGNLAVLVVIERQHGVIGGLPEQDWSLRVTLVFRHDAGEWWLVHRHADALVHPITREQLSALARGSTALR
jgi:ketosteroid isomerase-like protein